MKKGRKGEAEKALKEILNSLHELYFVVHPQEEGQDPMVVLAVQKGEWALRVVTKNAQEIASGPSMLDALTNLMRSMFEKSIENVPDFLSAPLKKAMDKKIAELHL